MNLTISNIKYEDLASSNATLVKYTIPKEGQTFDYLPQSMLDARTYPLSQRNGGGAYLVPVEKEKLYLNFVPKKVHVSDQEIKDYIGNEFTFFVPAEIIPPDLFTLPEGQFFRCVADDSLPEPKENYSYFIIDEGKKRLIPNYKTLEVMLFERNQTLLSVRIVPEIQCNDIPLGEPMPEKSNAWNEDMKDQTNFEAMKGLQASVKSGQALAEGAKKEAGAQIAAVKAQAEASKAEAEAAKAEAEAAKAASEQAIAEAQLAILQAQQKNS